MSVANNTTVLPLGGSVDLGIPVEARIFFFAAILSVSLLGIVSNVINMIIFGRLQAGDPINVNLLGLAVSDFLVSLTTIALVTLSSEWTFEHILMNWNINAAEVFYMTFGVPHTIFVRISVLLTAVISFERCLCVAIPLKVKMILSTGRAKISVVICFLVGGSVAIPIYYVNRIEWVHEPFLNMSIFRHVKTEEFFDMNYWFTPLEGVLLHVIPFLIVTVCTIVIIKSLKKRMAFRQAITRTNSEEIVQKEKKIAVMVLAVSTVFLICNFPNIILFMATVFYPSRFSLDSVSGWVWVVCNIAFLLDSINASINMFIYLTNSSNYRAMFKQTFGTSREKAKQNSDTKSSGRNISK